MAILTQSGRVAIAESIAARPLHLAWGTGDGDWTDPPTESVSATALMAEIGRRKASQVQYVVPDEAGTIVLPTGSFTISATPTNHLLITTLFEYADAPSSVIREVGLFVGTTVDPGLPLGQAYFTPAQVVSPGRMLHIENLPPIFRSPALRENFEIVITF